MNPYEVISFSEKNENFANFSIKYWVKVNISCENSEYLVEGDNAKPDDVVCNLGGKSSIQWLHPRGNQLLNCLNKQQKNTFLKFSPNSQ